MENTTLSIGNMPPTLGFHGVLFGSSLPPSSPMSRHCPEKFSFQWQRMARQLSVRECVSGRLGMIADMTN